MSLLPLQPLGWPRPRGHVHGFLGEGRLVVIGGQVGTDAQGHFAPDFVGQARQALANVVAVLAEAHGRPEHLARLTWFVTNMEEYRRNLIPLGRAYQAVMGSHFPTMTLVQVGALVEPAARVEIEATAILPPP